MIEFIHNFKKNPFSKLAFNIILLLVVLVPSVSSATDGVLTSPYGTDGIDSIGGLIGKFLEVIVKFGTPLAAMAIVYTGYCFVTAMGSEKKLTEAKSMLWWTVVGTALVVGAQAIYLFLQSTITSVTS